MQNNNLTILKGLFLGSSFGLIAGWFGMPALSTFILGSTAGLLAGLTKHILLKKNNKQN